MRVLYISYDGMTDPLGRSQVIPYLQGLAALGHEVTILSFEKVAAFASSEKKTADILQQAKIRWFPLEYHQRPPVLSTLLDLCKGRKQVQQLQDSSGFDLVHCRSYISSLIGSWMKRKYGIPYLFDMRGFWADERVEGGIWNLRNPLFKWVYRYFKKKEKLFFSESSHIISLTHAGKLEILKMEIPGVTDQKITVIPCCTDLTLFDLSAISPPPAETRVKLDIPADALVVSYLGSFGTWYMAEEMLDFMKILHHRVPSLIFLVITREEKQGILDQASSRGVDASLLRVVAAEREEVPVWLACSNLTLFFIRPTFSKKASSPTKMGEALSLGIPVICNDGIGDCTAILRQGSAGSVITGFNTSAYQETVEEISKGVHASRQEIIALAHEFFDLKKGIIAYQTVYQNIQQS